MNTQQKSFKIFFLLSVFFISAFQNDLKAQNIDTYYTFGSEIRGPRGLKVDASGNFYFIHFEQNGQQTISKLSPEGIVSTVVSGNYYIQYLAVNNAGNIFFVDEMVRPYVIKKVNPDGTVSDFASGNFYPQEIIFDAQGDLLFADVYNYPGSIKKIKPDGTISTIFTAPFCHPRSLIFDKAGTLYFTDYWNSPPKLRKVAPGESASSLLVSSDYYIGNLSIDTSGNLLFINTYNSPFGIIQITQNGTISVLADLSTSENPNSLTINQAGDLYFIDELNGQYVIRTIPSGPCDIPLPPLAIDTAICYGNNVSLSAEGSGTLKWYDAPTDGNLVHTGKHFITGPLTTTTSFYIESYFCNVTTIRTELKVTVFEPPAISITGNTTGMDSVILTASGGVSYLWSGGNSVMTAQNTFTRSGTYSVTVKNAIGCTGIANTVVTVNVSGLDKYGNILSGRLKNINNHGAIGEFTKVDRFGKIRDNGYDGKTAGSAAASANEIKQNFPASADGYYWIKNHNINGGAAFQIYADMTTDGGGWTLIMCNASNPGWNYANAISLNPLSPSITSNYSIIGWADHIKKSATGFQYMIDANTRNSFGGIWTANGNYSFVKNDNSQTNITLNKKFGTWTYHDSGIEQRMPWYSNCSGFITTSIICNGGAWWGTLIAESGWTPAPWISNGCGTAGCMQNPGKIWYWVR